MLTTCPQCQKKYRLAEKVAGKLVKCRGCDKQFAAVPETPVVNPPKVDPSSTKRTPAKAASRSSRTKAKPPVKSLEDGLLPLPPSRRQLAKRKVDPNKVTAELVSGFQGDFSRPKVTLSHRCVGLIVALLMLMLPVIYLGVIALVGYATYWHTTNNWVWMTNVRGGRSTLVVLMAYGLLAVSGVLWVLSLIKPLFMIGGGQSEQNGLTREEEPILYAFTDRLAEVVGSPKPDVISLTLDVNAYASYQTTCFGLRRKSFGLTIGLPLLAGMNLNQLAGIIAHEFGHFSQTGSMFLDRIIRRINFWFASAVYADSSIDAFTSSLMENEDNNALMMIFGFLIFLLVGLGKIILWLLMMCGHAVSCTLMRRMEYDADRYEIGIVGSEVFETSSLRLIELSLAHKIAGDMVFDTLYGEHLPNNFPAYATGIANQDPRIAKKAKKVIKKETSSWFASHPTTRDRIQTAKRINAPGLFNIQQPASVLMSNFRKKSKEITKFLYILHYGKTFNPDTMRSVDQALEVYENTVGVSKSSMKR